MNKSTRNKSGLFSVFLWIIAGLLVFLAIAFSIYVQAEEQVDHANNQRYRSLQLADELRQSSDDLTRMVRTYVLTGDPRFKKYYQDILDIRNGRKSRPDKYESIFWDFVVANEPPPQPGIGQAIPLLELMRRAGFSDQELLKLAEAKANSDGLTAREFEAMRLAEATGPGAEADHAMARRILYDEKYHQAKMAIMRPINDFFTLMDKRTVSAVQDLQSKASILRDIFLAFGLGLIVLLFWSKKFLDGIMGAPVDDVHAYITRIGGGDFSFAIPVSADSRNSVLGHLAEMQTYLREGERERQRALAEANSQRELLSQMAEQVPGAVYQFFVRPNGEKGFNFMSSRMEQLFGIKSELKNVFDDFTARVLPEFKESFLGSNEKAIREVSEWKYEGMLEKPSGEKIWFLGHSIPVRREGELIFNGILMDITTRKQAEEALRKSTEMVTLLLDSTAEAVYGLDLGGACTFVNAACLKILGYERPEQLLGKNMHEVLHSKYADGTPYDVACCPIFTAFRAGQGCHIDSEVLWRRDGTSFPAEYWSYPIRRKGEVLGAVVTFLDITERKTAENSLRQNEEKLRSITDAAQDAILMMDPLGRINYWNPAAQRILGYTAEEALGKDLHQLIAPARFHQAHAAAFPEFSRTGEGDAVGRTLELAAIRKDGSELPVELSLSAIHREDGWHAVGIMRDITQERKTEEQLAIDRKMIEKYAAEMAQALKDERRSREILSNLLAENNQVREKLEQSIREVEKNQQMLLQSEKLASIGQLAAGIAHEINNPTGFIGSNLFTLDGYMADINRLLCVTESLKAAIEAGDLGKAQEIEREVLAVEKEIDISYILTDVDNLLRESKEGVDRIGKIVRDLKMFSHMQADVFVPSSVCQIMDGVINIVWNEIKYKTEVKKDYRADPQVACNPQQIGQVFINLLVNAAQAIPDKGVISIAIYESEGFAHIDVSDTGCGIPPENMNKIFDAFFTTKEPGKGTGLGLGISATIIKKHGGAIAVESEVGRGTTFKISLPLEQAPSGTDNAEVG